MILMALDHASTAFNAGKLVTDGAFLYTAGTPLPPAQFLLRWVTHLCAPTFLFLAGTALALSVERRVQAGEVVDRHLATRGLIILSLDPLFVSLFWVAGSFQLQVLYAIGASMVVMTLLRRLPDRALLVLGLALVAGSELVLGGVIMSFGAQTLPGALLLHGGAFPGLVIAYPLLPWLGMMVLGWAFGRTLLEAPGGDRRARMVALAPGLAAVGLGVFSLVRGLNGYGNMVLYRDHGGLLQWLHVSKYPPSLSFIALELGLMFLVLTALCRGTSGGVAEIPGAAGRAPEADPLLVLGQTALFFYLAHIPLLEGAATLGGVRKQLGIGASVVAAVATVAILLPLCRRYRAYKAANPGSFVRYF